MLSTVAANNNTIDLPLPLSPSSDEATLLHPRVAAKLKVAKRMGELKTHLPLTNTAGQSLLEKMALGLLDDYIAQQVETSQEQEQDDSWLTSGPPAQTTSGHLETPKWIKELPPIKEPPQIDHEQLEKVKKQVNELAEKTMANNEQSLLDTAFVESIMTSEPSNETMMAPKSNIELVVDDGIVKVSTQVMPAIPTMPKPVTNPATPIPPVFKIGSKEPALEKNSDAIKPKETHFQIGTEKPVDAINAAIAEHGRQQSGDCPLCIKISNKFAYPLAEDMQKAYGISFYGKYAHIKASGEIMSIPVFIDEKLALAPNRIICIS